MPIPKLAPEKRAAQRRLAAEVTELVHKCMWPKGLNLKLRLLILTLACVTGEGVIRAETLTKMLFDSDYLGLQAEHVKIALSGDPRLVFLDMQELQATPVAKLAARYGLASSHCASTIGFTFLPLTEGFIFCLAAAKSLVASRGLYFNNQIVPEVQYTIPSSDLIDNRLAILRAGKGKLLVLVAN